MKTGSVHFEKIHYDTLNSKQKEIYNFQKVASALADYSSTTIARLHDDRSTLWTRGGCSEACLKECSGSGC